MINILIVLLTALIVSVVYGLLGLWKEEVGDWIRSRSNIVIEVKDNIGNTICAISIKNNKIDRNFKCSILGETSDIMFGTKSKLFVIQTK